MFAFLTIAASSFWLWAVARRALRGAPLFEFLALLTGLGLSLGILSILMMWLGLIPGAWLRSEIALAIPWIGVLISAWVCRHELAALIARLKPAALFRHLRKLAAKNLLLLFVMLICLGGLAVIAVNITFYPFYTADVLARYALDARLLFTSRQISSSQIGYPLGVQMLYTFGFMAVGAVNDHFANLYTGLFSAAMLGSVWLATRLMVSNRAAWAAVVLTLGAPLFVNQATSGYVDIPEGFFHGLMVIFAFLWLERGEARYAALAGLFCGLGLWLKQASLVYVPSLAVVPLLRLGWPLRWPTLRREAGLGALTLAVAFLAGGPWYLRNYLLAGLDGVIASANPVDVLHADRSLQLLNIFWVRRDQWGAAFALAFLAGFVLWLATLVWPGLSGWALSAADTRRRVLLVLAFIVPYHLVWWSNFTFEVRYLLASLPMYAAIAGFAVEWILNRISVLARAPAWAAAILVAAITLGGVYQRLGAVYYLVTDPMQSDDAKLSRLARGNWQIARYVRENIPPGAKIHVMDPALQYWLDGYQLSLGLPAQPEQFREDEYVVVMPAAEHIYQRMGQSWEIVREALKDPANFTEVYRSYDSILYAVHFP
ncbi:MAG: glycosyltransferase family 39 protein [Chloroflexi bacterium]|nr:glycosyltransferase family 39 protein [Chloroflexota bacterium]